MRLVSAAFGFVLALPVITQSAEWRPDCADLVRALAQPDKQAAIKPMMDYLARYLAQHYGDAVTVAPTMAGVGIGQGVRQVCSDPANYLVPLDQVADYLMGLHH